MFICTLSGYNSPERDKLSSYQLAVGARSLISGGDSRCSWVCFRATGPIEEGRSAGL